MHIIRIRKTITLLAIVLIFHVCAGNIFAQTEGRIGGKVYDKDAKTPLDDATIRAVNAETGASFQTTSNEDGCYEVEKLAVGTYSISVSHEGKEYLLAEKIRVDSSQENVAVSLCLALTEGTDLRLLDDCKFCGALPLGWIALGAAAAIAVGIIIAVSDDDDDDEVVSISTP